MAIVAVGQQPTITQQSMMMYKTQGGVLALRFSSLFFVPPIALGCRCRCHYVQGTALVLRHRRTTPSNHASCAQVVIPSVPIPCAPRSWTARRVGGEGGARLGLHEVGAVSGLANAWAYHVSQW